ncbi:MAG: DUF4838 domain-containing protein, partial [Verrucomicrobia bacterium]|nr:DUF4838 domain-containing protein [Verrucomicrobiota bacterium]
MKNIRHRIRKWSIACGCAVGMAIAMTAESADDWVVAWKGVEKASYETFTAPYAAKELAGYMGKVLGRDVTVVPWRDVAGGNVILVTEAKEASEEICNRLENKAKDAFVIEYPYQVDGKTVCLLASHDSYGYDFAVYHFLTKFMDVHWVGPGELGEVIPKKPDWKMPASISVLENPHYEHRFWNIGSFSTRPWFGRSMRMSWHHALGTVFDPNKYAKSDPEVYPLLADGKRYIPEIGGAAGASHSAGWQPCTTNPRSIEIATQHVLEDLEKNPERASASLSLNDGAGNFCLCKNCRALDMPDAFTPGRREDLSDRYFTFYNTVMENVLKKNPNAYIAVIQYGSAYNPPRRIKVHPRVLVFQVVPDMEGLCRWAPAGGGLGFHEWLYDGGYLQIRPDMRLIAELVRVGYVMGGRGFYSEVIPHWVSTGPRFYVLAHVLWNTEADVDRLYDEYFRLAYGKEAGPLVRTYFRRWDEIFNRQPKKLQYQPIATWRRTKQFKEFRRDDFQFMDATLAKAQAAPMTDLEKKRFAFLMTYHQWLRLNAEQYLLSRELADPEWRKSRSWTDLTAVIESSLSLNDDFNRIWQEQIAKDETGWLLDKNMRIGKNTPQSVWDDFYNQLRMLVASAHETAVDTALNDITQRATTKGCKDTAVAFWTKEMTAHPKLAAFIGPQLNELKGVKNPNLVENGDFEKGTDGEPYPKVSGWIPYQEYGMMKGTRNNYAWIGGRTGGH